MFESLVITLREGIEAALVIGIILAYLNKTGKTALNRAVYVGLILAVLASISLAFVFQVLSIDPESEVMEGAMLGVAGIFVASMVIWMWQTARNIKSHMETRLQSIVGQQSDGYSFGQALGLGFFTFLMVTREGFETVLFLAAATLGDFDLLTILGGILGIALAIIFAVLFIRGSLRINLSRFFTITGIVLLLLAIKLIAGSIHEFAEVEMIPMSKEAMAFIGYFVRDTSSTVILMALLAIPMMLILWDSSNRTDSSPEQASNPAERRKLLARQQAERNWRLALTLATLLIVLAMGTTAFAGEKTIDPVPTPISADGDEIRIPVSDIPEGQLMKFSYQSKNGTNVRFLVAALAGEKPMVAFDACEICGSVGYMQRESTAVCKNCNAPIAMSTLGLGGGCNPIALQSRTDAVSVAIATSELERGETIFRK